MIKAAREPVLLSIQPSLQKPPQCFLTLNASQVPSLVRVNTSSMPEVGRDRVLCRFLVRAFPSTRSATSTPYAFVYESEHHSSETEGADAQESACFWSGGS